MQTKTTKLTRAAVMIALATALSFFRVIQLPNGGSITAGSMIPIIFVSYFLGWRYSLLTAFTYSLLQMLLQGIAVPPVENFLYYTLVIFLDYILAYTVLGLAGIVSGKIKNTTLKYITGSTVCVTLRFICHLISGIIIWDVYAPEGQSVFLYSLTYNGSYMLGELIITVMVMFFISKTKFIRKQN